jgi:hypothetical protein
VKRWKIDDVLPQNNYAGTYVHVVACYRHPVL